MQVHSHSQLCSCGFPMELRTAAVFPLCVAMVMRCRRCFRLRDSPVALQSHLTSSSAVVRVKLSISQIHK